MFKPNNAVFKNWEKDLYIAKKDGVTYDDYNNEIVEYQEPFYFGKVNYQPLTGKTLESYIREYGETQNKIVCAFVNSSDESKLREFDKAYLYGATPTNELVNGDNANYVIKTFRPQNTRIMVIFEEIK